MWVVGVSEISFIKCKRDTYLGETDIVFKVSKVNHNCSLSECNIFLSYDDAIGVLNDIIENKDNIIFENNSIIESILEKDFDIDEFVKKLRIYELVPQEIISD